MKPKKKQPRKHNPAFTALWASYSATHSDADRNAILELFLPGIKSLVWRHLQPRGMGRLYDDCVSEAAIRVLKAIPYYDPALASFQTFYTMHVFGAVVDYLRSEDVISRKYRNVLSRIQKARHRLTQQLNRQPLDSEVSEDTGISEADVAFTDILIASRVSLSQLLYEPDAMAGRRKRFHNEETFQHMIRGLNRRACQMFALYFRDGKTMAEIGRICDVSESRVSQIFTESLQFLKEHRTREEYVADIYDR